ncbi:hypothetical protein [Actinoplanes sp. L3-i22]|uniref:hypothetical protein n=1 Tax=Actinoplanes sp. L3-i22 TaxID=2836373 RepID=UPI001C84423A|nr:hypothetical protein [Actinoplanes sp. L3-i22]
MADIKIPRDELEEARASLQRVLDHIDVTRGPGDLGAVVGRPVRDAAEHFEKRWGDGRKQLHRECEKIGEAMQKIIEGFDKVDQDSGNSLGSGS